MKKTISTLCLTLLICTLGQSQNIPSYVPTNGLVGWWPFNGNANDESGNGNNGTVNGATLTTDRFGTNNSCYSFNTSSYISTNLTSIGNTVNMDYPFTLSAWIKPDSLGLNVFRSIISKNIDYTDNRFSEFNFQITNINELDVFFGNGLASQYALSYWPSLGINHNNWQYIATTYANSTIKIYLNGILIDSSNVGTRYIGNSPVIIGRYINNNPSYPLGQYFYGLIDDIGIWNRALTQQEITALYQSQQTQCLPAYVPTSGLVGWWPFCGNANDESGNGNNGSVNGATLTADRFGAINSAYDFNGVNNSISTSFNGILGQNPRSISFWARTNSTTEMMPIVYGSNNLGERYNATFNYVSQGLTIGTGNSAITYNTQSSIADNNWHHYTFVLQQLSSPTTEDFQLFQDGVLLNVPNHLYNSTSLINTTIGYPLIFGGTTAPGNPNVFFNGDLDDIGIWNRALTQQEINSLYNASATSLSENTPTSSITAYPNPVSDLLNLKSDAKRIGSSYRMMDATGRIITNGIINSESMTLDMGQYASGMYLFIIGNGGDSIKIFKE